MRLFEISLELEHYLGLVGSILVGEQRGRVSRSSS